MAMSFVVHHDCKIDSCPFLYICRQRSSSPSQVEYSSDEHDQIRPEGNSDLDRIASFPGAAFRAASSFVICYTNAERGPSLDISMLLDLDHSSLIFLSESF